MASIFLGLQVASQPMSIFCDHALEEIKNRDGDPAKNLRLLVRGLRRDSAGRLYPVEGLKAFVSQPFTVSTDCRDIGHIKLSQ